MSKLIDLTGQTFGYWVVLERAPNNNRGQGMWKCKCTACGKEKVVAGGHLRAGRSTNCGCVRMEKMRQANIKHEEGKQYGFLKVERMATQEEKPRQDNTGIYWVCTCTKCGRQNVIVKGDYLRNGDTTSCGCLVSKNESIIADMLKTLNINFKEQYTFRDLTSTGRNCDRLIFDFAVFNTDKLLYLIEYDGQQHFNKKHAWDEESFNTTHINDLLKNQYCFNHNIPLIRIPYNKKYTPADLQLATTSCLLTPDNEEKYYERD